MCCRLGGGSSDAVAALKGLNATHGSPLSPERLHELAAALGSDCPLFLHDGPVVIRGRGERVTPVDAATAGPLAARLRPGDTIDFVVDPIDSPAFDSFSWSPVLKLVRGNDAASSGRSEWNAESDFAASLTQPAQALTPLEKLAQVLLAANEFVFVD